MSPENHKSPKIPLSEHNNTVFYVESEYQPDLNQFIQNNYSKLVKIFGSKNLNFYYLPFLLEDEKYWQILGYNRPYVHSVSVIDEVQRVYNHLIKKQNLEVNKGALMLSSNFGSLSSLPAFALDERDVSLKSFEAKCLEISVRFSRFSQDQPRFRRLESKFERIENDLDTGVTFDKLFEDRIKSECTILNYSAEIETADALFETEAFVLADEIRERIKLLKEYGSLSLIGDVIEEILEIENKISSLLITDDYRIYLKDYGMQEVVMSPLPKSLFLLFLNYPEGILFKELSDYHDELLSIYRKISLRENIDSVMESIKAMTDPLNNSVNEKCSRIRSAFMEVISDDLAKNYYITGKRGEPKKIILDRSLVTFSKDEY